MSPVETPILLTPTQVATVVRAEVAANYWQPPLLSALSDLRLAVLRASPAGVRKQQARRLLSALQVLTAFPRDGSGLRAADVARTVSALSTAAVYRWCEACAEIGLLERDEQSRLYKWAQLVA